MSDFVNTASARIFRTDLPNIFIFEVRIALFIGRRAVGTVLFNQSAVRGCREAFGLIVTVPAFFIQLNRCAIIRFGVTIILGRGQLVGRYRNIPEDSAFANYAQMRAYWKNCHGYDLPLTEPKNYYTVWFNGIRSSFLYPDFCVLSSEPQPIGFLEEQKTALVAVEEFSRSFFSEEHFICGERCKFIPSKSEFVRSHGPTSIDTAPLTGRRTLSGPNVRSDGHGSVVSKQLQQNGTQKNEEVSSPTKRLAGAFTKSLCQEALASPPVHMNSSKAKTIVKEARLFTSSNVKEKDEKHHVQQYLPTGSQCFSQTIRSRKRCVDVE